MFRQLVTNGDGSTAKGVCTEDDVLISLRRAVRLGYRVEATRTGGAVITRNLGFGCTHTVMYEPETSAARLTATMRRDLDAVDRRSGASLIRGRIHAGFYTVPAAATARLVSRGLVTVSGTAVIVSLTARLAMLAQDHRATASKPRGYYHDPTAMHFGPWRKGSCIHDRSSVASCPCRWSKPAGDVDDARRYAREHREHVTTALITAWEQGETTDETEQRHDDERFGPQDAEPEWATPGL